MKIFLDDIRNPPNEIGWQVCRGIADFNVLIRSGSASITTISFDHDLGESINGNPAPDGMSCANMLINWLLAGGSLPQLEEIRIHSMNPVGTINIIGLFESAQRSGLINKSVEVRRV